MKYVYKIAVIAIVAFICGPIRAQNQKPQAAPTAITVRSHRPLLDALDQLQQVLMKPINFEEAPLENVRDVGSSPMQAASGPIVFRFPIGGGFEAALPLAGTDAYSATQSVISAYQSAGLSSAIYQVIQYGESVDVLPTQVLAAGGGVENVTPVMQQHVSFPSATRSVSDTIELWRDTLTQVAGAPIRLANMPVPPRQAMIEFGANDQPAGEALLSLLHKLYTMNVYYRLLYDPNSHAYYLTTHPIAVRLGPAASSAPVNLDVLPRGNPNGSPYFTRSQ